MLDTKLIVDNVLKIVPEFEYQFGRPMKLLTKAELTNYQSKVLSVLQFVKEMTMSELADRLVMSKSQLTANVDVLVRLNLVERRTDPDDRRKIIIRMTEDGVRYIANTREAMCRYYDLYFDKITEEEKLRLYISMSQLLELLEKLNKLSQNVSADQMRQMQT